MSTFHFVLDLYIPCLANSSISQFLHQSFNLHVGDDCLVLKYCATSSFVPSSFSPFLLLHSSSQLASTPYLQQTPRKRGGEIGVWRAYAYSWARSFIGGFSTFHKGTLKILFQFDPRYLQSQKGYEVPTASRNYFRYHKAIIALGKHTVIWPKPNRASEWEMATHAELRGRGWKSRLMIRLSGRLTSVEREKLRRKLMIGLKKVTT